MGPVAAKILHALVAFVVLEAREAVQLGMFVILLILAVLMVGFALVVWPIALVHPLRMGVAALALAA